MKRKLGLMNREVWVVGGLGFIDWEVDITLEGILLNNGLHSVGEECA